MQRLNIMPISLWRLCHVSGNKNPTVKGTTGISIDPSDPTGGPMNTIRRLGFGALAFLNPVPAGSGVCGAKIQTEHLVVDDVQQQFSASELEKFSTDAEKAFIRDVNFWPVPETRGKIILELYKEHRDQAFSVFQMESTKDGKRSVVRVYGVKNPQEMVHKLTHALFSTKDKLIRNMMGIPTELRFGNPRSFPMCGYEPGRLDQGDPEHRILHPAR
jgi:hypothetical protein